MPFWSWCTRHSSRTGGETKRSGIVDKLYMHAIWTLAYVCIYQSVYTNISICMYVSFEHMCIWMYVDIYVCIHPCAGCSYIYTSMHIWWYTFLHIWLYEYNTSIHPLTNSYTYTQIHTHTYVHTYSHTHTWHMYAHICSNKKELRMIPPQLVSKKVFRMMLLCVLVPSSALGLDTISDPIVDIEIPKM